MNISYIPSPEVSSFHVGALTIHFYAICILTGIIAAVALTTRRWKQVGGTFDQICDISLYSVIAGIIGARVYHIITTPERFFGSTGDWTEMFRIWNGGLGIWGGVLFGALAALFTCKKRHYPAGLLADAVAPGLLIAQAIGRLGNWFNKELYGDQTTLPWGLKVDNSGVLYQPTFLYELLWNLLGACILIAVSRKVSAIFASGSLFAMYIMWYTLGRTFIESLRIDYSHVFLGVRINVWVSILVFVFGAVLFVILQRDPHPTRIELIEQLHTISETEKNSTALNKSDKNSSAASSLEDIDTSRDETSNETHVEQEDDTIA
ncbi:MAG: prolipoprotein diacylglyceryl transferase, partial [Bifidobacteriaceae bacterium]|nr:prolipoprotein diacylglyceryl transferase [Bifidobacteriaceae bacterium]